LLSIRPEYSKKIFSGEKRYEFRKRKPKKIIGKVFVYESSPAKNIVGWFSVRRIHSGSPKEIWEKCKDSGGIKEQNYFAYCNGTKMIHALEIGETFRFEHPLNPFDSIRGFKAPQDFGYICTGMGDTGLGMKVKHDARLMAYLSG
jgi:predicted transcriptional regulator